MCLGSTKKLMKIEPNLLNKLDLSKVQRAPGSLFLFHCGINARPVHPFRFAKQKISANYLPIYPTIPNNSLQKIPIDCEAN